MTKVGGRVTVKRSVVTDIRVDHRTGRLTVEGVDQDADGNTIKRHMLAYSPEQLNDVTRAAVGDVIEFAQREVDRA